nr:hypothetical transcript [Hymenolepis microstoma]
MSRAFWPTQSILASRPLSHFDNEDDNDQLWHFQNFVQLRRPGELPTALLPIPPQPSLRHAFTFHIMARVKNVLHDTDVTVRYHLR